nr:hypothetical protein [Clostridia bacterium]
MKHTETIKTVAVILLFCCMVTLAAFYIVNTQRLTMTGDSAVDIDRLLIIRSGGGELTEYDRSLVMPEVICFAEDGLMYGCLSDSDTLGDIYSVIAEPLMKLLGPDSSASPCTKEDGDILWNAYAAAEDLIYVRYHTPLPSPIIYAGLKGGAVSTPPEYASGDPVSIRELIITLEDNGGGAYEYSAAARDRSGSVTRYDLKTKRGTSFDLSELSGFKTSRMLVNCTFYASSPDTDYGLELSPTALITEAKLTSQLITSSDAMTGGVSDLVLRLFGFNPDRLNTYTESSGVKVYVEPGATLRHSFGSLHYDVTDPTASGIDVTGLLGYENYSGDYNVYELLCASGELIRRFKMISPMLCGGNASMLLTDIEYDDDDGSITIGFGLTFGGIMLCGTDYDPIRSLEVTYNGGRITEVTLNTTSFIGTASAIACFPQSWTMNGISAALAPDDDMCGDIKLAYIVSSDEDSMAAFSSDWLYVQSGT